MFRSTTGPDRTLHFINICREIWPKFEWHPDAIEMAEAVCENDVSGFTSGGGTGKSDILAKFGNVSWFSNPVDTLVIVCSTTAIDARQKIWGHIVRNFRDARVSNKSVGNLIESMNIIRLSDKTDGMGASDNSSISLVAAGDQYKDDALKRLQGRHQKHVILLLDELQDCSQEIITTAIGNLSANAKFEVHAAGNASSRYDAHGLFMTPVEGWNSINKNTHKWKIRVGGKEGVAMHFDATSEKSTNMKRMMQGLPIFTFLRKPEECMAMKAHLGENNPIYLRQYVGFWSAAEGETDFLYTDVQITVHEGNEPAVWRNPPSLFAGIDPAYSLDGDRFMLDVLKYGLSDHGVWTVEFHENIHVRPVPIKGETRDHAAVRECRRICEKREIAPRNVGMDASAGTALLSMFHQLWSPDILGVQFGGSPTDLPISTFDKRLGSDVYANAVSELWGIGVEFLNAGQIRGLKPSHIKELTSRKFEIVAGGKVKVEKKGDMKKRLGFSPDESDAGFVGLRVIRERLKIQAGANTAAASTNGGDWKKLQRRLDVVSRTEEAMRDMVRNHFR